MAFASFERQHSSAPMSEINMVPLIDVMLVLLVIFIVTAPLLTHSVKLQLPRASSQATPAVAEKIEFAIDAQGARYWNGERLSREEAAARLLAAGRRAVQPEVHLRADQDAAYRHVAQTLADAASAGLVKIGFVSHPLTP